MNKHPVSVCLKRVLILAAVCTAALGYAQPTVTITSPAAAAAYSSPSSVTLTASAAPSAGASITSVSFYQGTTLIGQATAAPYSITWSTVPVGSYSLTAVVADSTTAHATSAAVSITVLGQVAYTNDFESAQGFTTGALNGQGGWTAAAGANVVGSGSYSGSQSVTLGAGSPVASLTSTIAPTPNQGIVYFDYFAKPAADSTIAASSLFSTGEGEFGFLLGTGGAAVQALDGNGSGGGTWVAGLPVVALPVDGGGHQTVDWHRFTLREDFTAATWDLSVDGHLVAYDLHFKNPAGPTLRFAVAGHADAPTGLDYLYAGVADPLFTDTANDGIPDSWKTLYGLSPASNLRHLSPNGSGLLFIDYYCSGANPADALNGRAFTTTADSRSNQVAYTYDSSGRLTKAVYGNLASQSFTLDGAANLTSAISIAQPIVAWRAANALATDGSGNGADTASPAGDTLPNLVKYALGLSPASAAAGSYPSISVIQSGGSSYLALEYHRPEPAPSDLAYSVEVSSDGIAWYSGSGSTVAVSSTTSGGTADVVVRDATAASPPLYGRLIRLHVTRISVSL